MQTSAPQPDTTRSDVEHCRSVIARHSRSFHAASHLLPAGTRDDAVVTYAFCRGADDDVDDAPSTAEALRRHHLTRSRLLAAHAGAPMAEPVWRAFSSVLRRRGIPLAEPMALLDGMEMDLQPLRVPDEDSLLLYCYRAAGVVGSMMSRILGAADALALQHAVDLGVAMQLTNIARDVGEDARRGRVYLPRTWFDEVGASQDEVFAGVPTPGIRAVTLRTLELADRYYASGLAGVRLLPWIVRPAIIAAAYIYRDIGRLIRARGGDSMTSRARTSGMRKLVLAVAACGSFVQQALLQAPPRQHSRSLHDGLARMGIRT